jgi:flagellin-like hook-associated protein FlgL
MSDVVLSAGVRQNLLSLQSTASLMATTQNRLATGKKVNTALDNPTNFFTSAALNSRAGDLSALLDSMSNGIKTLEAADNGITAITKTIEQMQSTLRQARQDKSFKSDSYAINLGAAAVTQELDFSGGSVTGTQSVELTNATGVLEAGANYANMDFDNAGVFGQTLTFNIAVNGGTNRTVVVSATNATTLSVTVDGGAATTTTVGDTDGVTEAEMVTALNAAFDAAATPVAITTTVVANRITFTADTAVSNENAAVTVTGVTASAAPVVAASFGFSGANNASQIGITAKTVDALVSEINANANLTGRVRASNDNGRLRVENLSTADLLLTGLNTATGEITGGVGTSTIGGNTVRANFVAQFNGYIDQLNKLSDDASFNGVNLLRGDKLKITFNEAGTSTIEIQAKDVNGNNIAINTSTLGILQATNAQFDSDDTIDARLTVLGDALGMLRSQGSAFGSNLSIVQNRQDFTKAMINTLETGADNLVLADSNEEGANMLALQTRQQLSTTALSLSAQADQAVLRLFG